MAPPVKHLSRADYAALLEGAAVWSRDAHGIKVAQGADGDIIKLFRSKRLLSSTRLFPYAQRFRQNSERLAARGIPTVKVKAVYRCPGVRRDLVVYRPLPGTMLREALAESAEAETLLLRLAEFLAGLHRQGVYFRSIHFGNIIVAEDGRFGLIDVAAMHVRRRALGPWRRARNFRHLLRYPEDRQAVNRLGFEHFLQHYLAEAGLGKNQKHLFRRLLRRYVSA